MLTDASGVNNDERVNLTLNPFIDFEPGEGGGLTGLGGPLFDCPYVFKLERIYKMVRTGNSPGSLSPGHRQSARRRDSPPHDHQR